MNDTTQVIVLSQMDYKENDALIKVFSYDYGLITFLAKGIRKINSKNRSICMPYTISDFMFNYHENSQIQSLLQGQIVQNHYKIHEDLQKSGAASLCVELIQNLIHDENEIDVLHEHYEFTKFLLDQIEEKSKQNAIMAFMLSSYMNYYGISPHVDSCVMCDSTKINSISIEEGGLICNDCQLEIHSPLYTIEFLKEFRLSQRINQENFENYCAYKDVSEELILLLVKFLEYHTGVTLKSWEFIRKWSIIM
jgi:DNA repair protein RecO (recombination protein O)